MSNMIEWIAQNLYFLVETHNRFFIALKALLNPNPDMAFRAWYFNLHMALVASLIFVLTIRLFYSRRRPMKREMVRRNLQQIGEQLDEDTWGERWTGYLYPTILMSLIILFGTSSVLGVVDLRKGANILTMGIGFKFSNADENAYVLSLVAFQWGFVGAFVYAVQDIARRLVWLDLAPRSLFAMSIRIVVASLVALVVQLYLLGGEEGASIAAIPIAFSVGFFPQRGLHLIEGVALNALQKVSTLAKQPASQVPDLPLTLLSGASSWGRARLREEVIDTVRDLADTSMRTLLLNAPFSLGQLSDWKDQAELICHFPKELKALQTKAGIYHASQFVMLGSRSGGLKEISSLTGVSEDRLQVGFETLTKVLEAPEKKDWRLFK